MCNNVQRPGHNLQGYVLQCTLLQSPPGYYLVMCDMGLNNGDGHVSPELLGLEDYTGSLRLSSTVLQPNSQTNPSESSRK